jgi:hypothetical protein
MIGFQVSTIYVLMKPRGKKQRMASGWVGGTILAKAT